MSRAPLGSIQAAWEAAVAVTANAYGVDAELIRAQSRGRGPRPPSEIWEPRKMAVHLAIIIADCSYASLGRVIGLHRDTVASHCAEMRDHILGEARAETASVALEKLARARLSTEVVQRIDAMRAQLAMLEETAGDLVAMRPFGLSTDDLPTKSPTTSNYIAQDHGNVIVLAKAGAKR